MPEPASRAGERPLVEILPPARFSCPGAVVCDCCRQRKSRDEFDEDAFGICSECLCSDVVVVDILVRLHKNEHQ